MASLDEIASQLQQLLQTDQLAEAEALVDRLAASDLDALSSSWGLPEEGVRHYLSIFYNNIGYNYQGAGAQAHQSGDMQAGLEAARCAEGCHGKALDIYDMAAEDFMWLPSKSPFTKNMIFTFWGLGTAKYVLQKPAESRKYFGLCLRLTPEDEQAEIWQADAGTYLRLLDRRSVQMVLRAQSIMPNLFDPQLLSVQGELLEWGAYSMPREKQYIVYVGDEEIRRLEALGFPNPIALEGHTLVLSSDESGDLRRPLRIVEVM